MIKLMTVHWWIGDRNLQHLVRYNNLNPIKNEEQSHIAADTRNCCVLHWASSLSSSDDDLLRLKAGWQKRRKVAWEFCILVAVTFIAIIAIFIVIVVFIVIQRITDLGINWLVSEGSLLHNNDQVKCKWVLTGDWVRISQGNDIDKLQSDRSDICQLRRNEKMSASVTFGKNHFLDRLHLLFFHSFAFS